MSPSVYETARLVTLAPRLYGHESRLDFLLREQDNDGGWGGPEGYALVPTLSATEALLTAARAGARPAIAEAADRGLRKLFAWLSGSRTLSIPDTPAIEIIVPALLDDINDHLRRLVSAPVPGLDRWCRGTRLSLPAGMDGRPLIAVRSLVRSGTAMPAKLLHSLEVAGDLGSAAPIAVPPPGTVGASPAATAAWVRRHPDDDAGRFLDVLVRRYGGPVPSVVPVTTFERAWVLNALARGGLHVPVPQRLVAGMAEHLGPDGTPGGAGLPPDADTTSAVLVALGRLEAARRGAARHGVAGEADGHAVHVLRRYETDSHFVTWHGERSPSTSTNAHVLEALGGLGITAWERQALAKVVRWLADQQHPAGYWLDKWHASPYYATACCAIALHRYGGRAAEAVVRGAVTWLYDTQGADGSWGWWGGTAEETAYALQTLSLAAPESEQRAAACARGYTYLLAVASQGVFPPLWHDKDLYTPVAVVRAEILAALNLVRPGGRSNVDMHRTPGRVLDSFLDPLT